MKEEFDHFLILANEILWDLKRLNHNYDSFTIESFFGSKLGPLLYSSLGLRTVRDLVNVDALTLGIGIFESDFSEMDSTEFYEVFQALYEFFENS